MMVLGSSYSEEVKMMSHVVLTEQGSSSSEEEEKMTSHALSTEHGFSSFEEEKMTNQVWLMD